MAKKLMVIFLIVIMMFSCGSSKSNFENFEEKQEAIRKQDKGLMNTLFFGVVVFSIFSIINNKPM